MKTKIRVGIVGAGTNTRERHIPGFRAIDGVEIVSVANRSRESSQRAAREFGIPAAYENWRGLVEADDTDAVLIGTWPYLHYPVTITALEAGKHVLCEARMAMNAEEARAMYEVSLAHPELIAQVVPSPYTLGVDRTVKRLIREGFPGEIISVEVLSSTGTLPDSEAPLHWRQNREYSGLNIMNLGILYEALMRWVGPAVNVSAVGKTVVKMRLDAERGERRAVMIPDHLHVICDMACGAVGSFTISSVTGPEKRQEITIYGTEGTLRFRDGALFSAKRRQSRLSPVKIPDEERAAWRVEEEFIRAIRGEEQVRLTTFADGLAYMEFTEAVAMSMIEGKAIALPG